MPQRYVVAGDVGHRALEILRLIDKYRVKRRKQSRLAGVHSHRRNAEHGVRAKNNVRVIQIRLAPEIRVKAGARLGCLVTSYRGGNNSGTICTKSSTSHVTGSCVSSCKLLVVDVVGGPPAPHQARIFFAASGLAT